MSYQKYYGRQFVKLAEDKYIPLILWGANNCTEFVNGREVLERYWCSFSPTEITDVATFAKFIWKKAETNPNGEVWMNGSKWVYWANIPRWMTNSFGSAKTIEEIYYLTGKSLTITFSKHDYSTGRNKVDKTVTATTSAELLDFFEYYESLTAEEKRNGFLWYDFGTREPLKFPKPNIEGKVIVKDRSNKRYLSSYISGKELNFTSDPNKALVFENAEEALTQLGRGWRIKFVSAKALEEAKKPKYFAIYTGYHGFVKERSRSRLYFTRDKKYAKLFKTEKEAERYMEKLKCAFSLTFGVVDIRKVDEEND